MPEFVFNRTQHHVDRLKLLQKKGYSNLSASELEEYRGYATLGAYNYTDVNRVTAATKEVGSMYGLSIPDRATATKNTLPFKIKANDSGYVSMGYYLDDVKAVRDAALALNSSLEFPELPDSMDNLTWKTANNIEETLYIAYQNAPGVLNTTAELGIAKLGSMILGES